MNFSVVFPSSVVHKDALVDVAMYFSMEKHFFWSISSIKMFIYHSYQLPVLVCYYMYKCMSVDCIGTCDIYSKGWKVNKVQFLGGGGGVLIKNIETLYTLYYLTLGFFQGFFFYKTNFKTFKSELFWLYFCIQFQFFNQPTNWPKHKSPLQHRPPLQPSAKRQLCGQEQLPAPQLGRGGEGRVPALPEGDALWNHHTLSASSLQGCQQC